MPRFFVGVRLPVLVLLVLALAGTSCRPSDVLSVPPPIGVLQAANDAAGAEGELTGAIGSLSWGVTGPTTLLQYSGLLTDELHYAAFNEGPDMTQVGTDARDGQIGSMAQIGAAYGALQPVIQARAQILVALAAVQQYEPTSSHVGLAYALTGYSELFLAESFCSGVTLSTVVPGGGWQYASPLTTDSLLGTAEAHFDLALKYAAGNDTVTSLASVGLGRTRLDRGNFAGAGQAVTTVPIGFVYGLYNAVYYDYTNAFNLYSYQTFNASCSQFNVADVEGGNGLNFVSAGDPRLVFNIGVNTTCDGATWYYPLKMGVPSTFIPIATGVEAQLILAEVALQSNNVTAWAADLNALRANAPSTYLGLGGGMNPLTADSTTAASGAEQVSVMFRERAFWLYGMGTRLSDMRRLVRQYERDPGTVFPTGTYVGGESPELSPPIPNYGTDVSFAIPSAGAGLTPNPAYKGCLSPPSTA